MASQDSTALVLIITITKPGRGFKAGGSVKGREVLPWEEGAGPPAARQHPGAVHTVHREPEVLPGRARGAPSSAGVAAGVCRQRLPDLQGSWKTVGRGEAAGGLAGTPCPGRGCAAPCCTSGQDAVAPSSAAQLSPLLAP